MTRNKIIGTFLLTISILTLSIMNESDELAFIGLLIGFSIPFVILGTAQWKFKKGEPKE